MCCKASLFAAISISSYKREENNQLGSKLLLNTLGMIFQESAVLVDVTETPVWKLIDEMLKL